jgi:hypothetical protein
VIDGVGKVASFVYFCDELDARGGFLECSYCQCARRVVEV